MKITMQAPPIAELDSVIAAVASWQRDGLPIQLHPGDLGWHWRFGAAELAESLRVWTRDEEIVAVGFLDGEALIRMALTPIADRDGNLAQQLVRDIADPSRGVLPAGAATVEARFGHALRSLLHEHGWAPDDPWTPLYRDLAQPVETSHLRVEIVGPALVEDRVAVQRAVFEGKRPITTERWHTMAAGPPYRQAKCLVGYDDQDTAVAIATVWSAGCRRPGLIEPLGVHRDHRGRGHGVAMTLAATATLQQMRSSSAIVTTPSANQGAVATYAAAGFMSAPDVTDFLRPA